MWTSRIIQTLLTFDSFLKLHLHCSQVTVKQQQVELYYTYDLVYQRPAIISLSFYMFYPIFTAVYIVEWLVSQTIYVLDKEILRFLGLKSAVYNRFRSKACYNGESAVFSLQMKPCNCNIFFLGQAGRHQY